MKRTLFVMAVVLGFATAASAATLSVVSDKLTYTVGETITLTVSGDDEGATAYSLLGRLLYSGALTDPNGVTQTSAGTGWISGTTAQGDGFTDAFNQLDGTFAGNDADNYPAQPVSIVTLIAEALGIVNVTWSSAAPELLFFGIAHGDAQGTSFEIVPEPTTAVLLGLGLFGLAVGGRRRS